MSHKIAFFGTGNMGEPMVRLLLKAGYEVAVVPHRRREAVARLESEGAQVADTPAEAAEGASFLITMVPDLPQIEDLLFKENGILERVSEGTVLINMSTVSPTGIQKLGERLIPYGVKICDAPVSGGPFRAADGTLSIMAGAEKEIFEKSLDILRVLGKNISCLGELGTGQVAKLCNNMLSATIMAANAEVLTMGAKAGLDAESLRNIIVNATGTNWQLENWVPNNVMKDNYEAGFALKLMYKDVGLSRDFAKEIGSPLFIGNLVHELYGQFMNSGLRDKDFSVVSTFYQDAANVTIANGKPRNE